MRRHTVLIEFANGDGPGYHMGMQVLGGDVVAVQFSDALAELERVNELNAQLLEALTKSLAFIDGIREDLHSRRATDWFPEAANNAATDMSEDMRLIGNACADFDVGDIIAAATGETE